MTTTEALRQLLDAIDRYQLLVCVQVGTACRNARAALAEAAPAAPQEPDITEALDFERLRNGERRALFEDHQWAFDKLNAQPESKSVQKRLAIQRAPQAQPAQERDERALFEAGLRIIGMHGKPQGAAIMDREQAIELARKHWLISHPKAEYMRPVNWVIDAIMEASVQPRAEPVALLNVYDETGSTWHLDRQVILPSGSYRLYAVPPARKARPASTAQLDFDDQHRKV
jgi:hypothetical protein